MHVKIKISGLSWVYCNLNSLIFVPRTGLEPARLSTLAPETSASTIPPPGLLHSEPLPNGNNGLRVFCDCKVKNDFLFIQILRRFFSEKIFAKAMERATAYGRFQLQGRTRSVMDSSRVGLDGFLPGCAKTPSRHRTNPYPLRSMERILMDSQAGGETPPLPI